MDYLIIGAGLTGSVIARHLAEQGKKVIIWERRDHIAGNLFDYIDPHGILVQKYGPHAFHCKEKSLYEYICRFADWTPFALTCGAVIDGVETPTPFNFKTIDDFYSPEKASLLKSRIKEVFGLRQTVTVLEALECEDILIREYAQFLFDKDYSRYTAKQWGVPPDQVDPSVLRRVPLRFSYKEGYFDDEYQVTPSVSYTEFFKNLLNHPNLSVKLNMEALNRLGVSDDGTQLLVDGQKTNAKVVYTGALDELFSCVFGKLPYRSLRFEWRHEERHRIQGYPVVAYPQAEGYTRITEFNQIPIQESNGTTYALEFSLPYRAGETSDPYYPVLTDVSQKQYAQYKMKADSISNLHYCGRLADFQYYNMDQALANALDVCKRL